MDSFIERDVQRIRAGKRQRTHRTKNPRPEGKAWDSSESVWSPASSPTRRGKLQTPLLKSTRPSAFSHLLSSPWVLECSFTHHFILPASAGGNTAWFHTGDHGEKSFPCSPLHLFVMEAESGDWASCLQIKYANFPSHLNKNSLWTEFKPFFKTSKLLWVAWGFHYSWKPQKNKTQGQKTKL